MEDTNMAEEVKKLTIPELQEQIKIASAAGDWKAVSKCANEMIALEKEAEKTEREAKQKAVADLTLSIKKKIDEFIAEMKQAGELDSADGVWYADDFGTTESSLRLLKSQPKAAKPASGSAATASHGGGGGKKFDVKTEDLLKEHGTQAFKKDGKDTEVTLQAQWDSSPDKNNRYRVREQLLKIAGYIQ
jgi:hypothetical protein